MMINSDRWMNTSALWETNRILARESRCIPLASPKRV